MYLATQVSDELVNFAMCVLEKRKMLADPTIYKICVLLNSMLKPVEIYF